MLPDSLKGNVKTRRLCSFDHPPLESTLFPLLLDFCLEKKLGVTIIMSVYKTKVIASRVPAEPNVKRVQLKRKRGA